MSYTSIVEHCQGCPFNHSLDEVYLSKGEFICWLDDDGEVKKEEANSLCIPTGCPLKKHGTVTFNI